MKNRKRNQPPEDIILPTEDIEREYFPDYFKEKMEKADRKKSISDQEKAASRFTIQRQDECGVLGRPR